MDSMYSTFEEASEKAKSLAAQGESVSLKRDGDAWVVSVGGSPKEAKETTEKNPIYVGRFITTGAIVVFDHSIEIDGIDNLFGYVPARDLMRQFELNQKDATHLVLGEEKDNAICKYMAWKKKNVASYIDSQKERLESKKQRAIQKHKDYLNKIGKTYSGVNLKTTKVHRVTHCYSCKEKLDSDFHIECNACKWLICECGVCGCGYEYRT